MKKLSVNFLLIGSLAFFGCENDVLVPNNQCVEISGPVVSETRAVSDFNSIHLMGVGNILLTQGLTQELRIVTHQNILDIMSTSVENETLDIDFESCSNGNITQLDIFITIPEIRQLEIEGVGNITSQNEFTLSKLEVELQGVGDISLAGTADTLEITSSGVGNIHAFDITTKACEVLISGTGNVEVTVENSLEVIISGAGSVLYKGNPTIDANISGSGSLIDTN